MYKRQLFCSDQCGKLSDLVGIRSYVCAVSYTHLDVYKRQAMVYAKNAGRDVDVMLKSISTGAAGSAQMNNVASKAAKDDYAPGFFLSLIHI